MKKIRYRLLSFVNGKYVNLWNTFVLIKKENTLYNPFIKVTGFSNVCLSVAKN